MYVSVQVSMHLTVTLKSHVIIFLNLWLFSSWYTYMPVVLCYSLPVDSFL